jgi:hypothetical protein
MFEHFRGDWAYAEPIFCWEVSEFFLNVHFGLLDGILDGFSKFRFFTVENGILIRLFWVLHENFSMHTHRLSIRGNDFIAYAEKLSSHTDYTANEFLRMLSRHSYFDSFHMVSSSIWWIAVKNSYLDL